MTSANSALLLAGYDAWNHDDCGAWLELLDPDVEIRTSGVFPDLAPAYRGHDRAVVFWNSCVSPGRCSASPSSGWRTETTA